MGLGPKAFLYFSRRKIIFPEYNVKIKNANKRVQLISQMIISHSSLGVIRTTDQFWEELNLCTTTETSFHWQNQSCFWSRICVKN